jgi:CRP-like cAMP-binding protein
MNVIFEYFNRILPISEKEINEITPFLKTITLEKDDFFLEQNQICKSLAFITNGSIRSFHIKLNGSTINIMLSSENEFVSDLDSFVTKTPSNLFIQAIEKTELITITKDDLDTISEGSLFWTKLGKIMTEHVFIIVKQRLESLLYKSPTERYMELQNNYPEFLNKYSLTDIASFIGVTRQSLSRIRAKA